MAKRIWFHVDDSKAKRIEDMDGKSIHMRAVLPDGTRLNEVAQIWARVVKKQGSVTVVFPSCILPSGKPGHYRFHLTPDQEKLISLSSGTSDFQYDGVFEPCPMGEHRE